MFNIEIEILPDLTAVETRISHEGVLVKNYKRAAPRSLLTDAIRFITSGHASTLDVIFENTKVTWAPGAYQITLDAFRLLLAVRKRLANQPIRSLIDVGCGSGVVGLNLLSSLDGLEYIALLDLSESALQLAEENFYRNERTISAAFIHSDFGSLLRESSFDVAVSNPPYFPAGSIVPKAGQITMSDEFSLYSSLVEAVGIHSDRIYMTRSEAFAPEVDAILETRPELSVTRLASWKAPIPGHLIAPPFLGRFDRLPGSTYEVEHEVSVLELVLME